MTTDIDKDEMIKHLIERLAAKNPEVDHELIETIVREEYEAIEGRPVKDYLSILAERAAKKRLR